MATVVRAAAAVFLFWAAARAGGADPAAPQDSKGQAPAAQLSSGGVPDLEALRKQAEQFVTRLNEPPAPPAISKVKAILNRGIVKSRNLPLTVRIQGVVTSVSPDRQPWLFVQDDTSGIMVMLARGTPPAAGHRVTIEGPTAGGSQAPYLNGAKVIADDGPGAMPLPRQITPGDAQGVQPFGQWVETEGILRDAYVGKDGLVRVQVARARGAFETLVHIGGEKFMDRRFLEATVRVRGVCWRHADAHMQTPDADRDITVVGLSEKSGFDRPAEPAAALLEAAGDRVSLVRATFALNDLADRWRLVAEDGTIIYAVAAWPWENSLSGIKPYPPEPGTPVLLTGLFMKGNDMLVASQAWMRPVEGKGALPEPVRTTPAGARSMDYTGHLLTVRGRLVKMEERRTQRMVPPYDQVPYIVASIEGEDDGAGLNVVAPVSFREAVKAVPGDRLIEITGYQIPPGMDSERKPQLWPRTAADIAAAGFTREATRTYAWWGAGGLGVLILTGAGFLWALREKLKRQRSEAAIISAHNATLETRVAERTAELAAANERLSRASGEALATLARERELGDMKTNFVSMVSHEFRTPLAVILSSTELLTNHLERLSAERRAQQLASIRGSTQQMARLIEEVLLLGKVEAGRMTFTAAEVPFREFCHTLADEALSASARRCPVKLTVAAEVPAVVQADASLLRHIFSNLLSNAAKYSAEGSEVRWEVKREGERVVSEISDRGIGIPEEDMPNLFVPFHRARNVGQITGTGLGLMIVKRCVELHGGDIAIQSAAGEGTTVTVRFPIHSITANS